MKRVWALTVILLSTGLLASAQTVPVQRASDSNTWGDPVDGIQLRLAVSKNSPPRLPGQLPRLEIQMRNIGTGTAAFDEECVLRLDIEIDGAFYTPEASICSNAPPSPVVTPGKQGQIIQINVSENYRAVDPRPGLPSLIQGRVVPADKPISDSYRHSIRIRAFVNVTGGGIRGPAKITLVSNAITVDVRGPPTAQEQALADAISKMKSILTDLPANVPELAVANVAHNGNTVMAFYNPASNPNEAHGPPGVPIYAVPASQRVTWFLTITIDPYDSPAEAQHGLEAGLFQTQVSPTQGQDLNGSAMYKWDQGGGYRLLFRVAASVVNIETSRPEAKPIADKAFQSLRQVLGTN